MWGFNPVALLRCLSQEHFLLVLASQVYARNALCAGGRSTIRIMINVAKRGSYGALERLFLAQQ